GARLASHRSSEPGQFSLSPSSLADAPSGLRLVLPSPNGSELSRRGASMGKLLLAGCFRNAAALAAFAHSKRKTDPVAVIPAGERWPDGSLRVALEDWWGAGAIIKHLPGPCSVEAAAAATAFDAVANRLLPSMVACTSGRELVERGFHHDIELAADYN